MKVLYLARKTCKDLTVNENQAQHNPGFWLVLLRLLRMMRGSSM